MEKTLEKDQQAITAGAQTDQLSDKDFEKVVGGDGISEIVIIKHPDISAP
jgi:hypothetical protein